MATAMEARAFRAMPRRTSMRKLKMKNRDWAEWAVSAGIRAIKTVAQTAVATIGTAAVMGEVNWAMVGSAAVLSGILSLLTSVAGLPETVTK